MPSLKETKILFMEDDPIHRQMYGFQFNQLGFTNFTTVSSGQDGLDAVKQDPPDLILLDIGLEDIDGIEVLRRLKADAAMANVPVIVLSNMREQDKGEEAKKLGADDYILKAHFLPREVVSRVERFLTKRNK